VLKKYQFDEYQKQYRNLSDEDIQSYKRAFEYASLLNQKIVIVEKDVNLIESKHPQLLTIIQRQIENFHLINPTVPNVIKAKVFIEAGEVPFLKLCLKIFMEECSPLIWYLENSAQIEEEIQKIKDQRLLALMEAPTAARARDDLSRDFYRTLTELRKHQAWRQRQQLIDITPKNA
jgi:hypothetical protein